MHNIHNMRYVSSNYQPHQKPALRIKRKPNARALDVATVVLVGLGALGGMALAKLIVALIDFFMSL